MVWSATLALAGIISAAAAAPAVGSIYGKVVAQPSFFLSDKNQTFARRMALPLAALRAPAGVMVVLEGEPFAKEKFPLPTETVRVEASKGGFDQSVVGFQVGAPFVIENLEKTALRLKTLSGNELVKEPIAPGEKRSLVLPDVGVFQLRDEDRPDVTLTLIVTSNPFVLPLDDTGEFLFDELTPGNYTVKVYTNGKWVAELPVQVKLGERANLNLPLGRPRAEKKGDAK